jgi:hypothetical protein
MEMFCALLAGFFFWLLTFHWMSAARAQAREVAGPLLLEVRGVWPRKLVWGGIASAALGLTMIPIFVFLVNDDGSGMAFIVYFVAAENVCVCLSVASSLHWQRIGFEVREHGLVVGRMWFLAWSDVVECKWSPAKYPLWSKKSLRIQMRSKVLNSFVAPEQAESLTGVLGRFVPVYDTDGALLIKPPADERPAGSRPPERTSHRYLLQFDLKFMFLLTVVVACAASCYGVRYRRLKPRWDAVARLEALGSKVNWIGGSVWDVDFTGCKNGPTDDDLACLELLDGMNRIDLSGRPVSDAGLAHLGRVKSLRWINLKGTKVTAGGVAELRRALPAAYIEVTPAPAVSPVPPSPPSLPTSLPPPPPPPANTPNSQ